MTSDLFAENLRPVDDLHDLLRRHGLLRTLLALPFAALRPHKVQDLRDHDLSQHLLRDIGLFHEPRPARQWELR